jgi:hypothetical protein
VIKLRAATEVQVPEKAEALLNEILSEVSADDQSVTVQSSEAVDTSGALAGKTGQGRAGASTAEHHRAAASKVCSQSRSHLMILRAAARLDRWHVA